ncbi:hypothetical protein BUALT_Bualt14G0028700 [Buddleja alternifolia]|uniref:non-specific serine/threonine protein kinase n=1 Tax=Buddleja alternifolia TaxID=168488 RepID=A0AAV6WMC0_9LAMI|nr:hypothetical protein BUALT_Bualt14G0028700 [Buddleja alternifolia]
MENSCFLPVVVVTLVLLNYNALCSTRTISDEDALIAFKSTITSDPHGILANNWSIHNTSICYWIGVSCSIKHQRVTALNFSGFRVEGTIAPHLGNLTFLRSLDISKNSFTGVIPYELSNLRRLKEINVGYNSFTGEIPSWFGNLPELQSIQLTNNEFSGSISPSLFNTTSKLLVLDMSYNYLDGNVPQEIANFRYTKLSLGYNNFITVPASLAGNIPSSVFNMSSLKILNLANTSLSGSFSTDTFYNLPELEELILDGNHLTGKLLSTILESKRLSLISVVDNELTATLLDSHHHLRSPAPGGSGGGWGRWDGGGSQQWGSCSDMLEELHLHQNSRQIFSSISASKRLRVVLMFDNELTGGIPKQIGNLTSLKHLYLDNNILTGELPQELGNLVYLEDFSVKNNSLSGPIPFFVFNISTMKYMDLSVNHFSGDLPSASISLSNLEILYLSDNKISGRIPSFITNASKLTKLEMDKNSFTGSIPDFGHLRLLQCLFIGRNILTGGEYSRFFSSLTNCQHLKYFDISENPLNGILPASVGNLSKHLETFKAQRCNIKGAIPSEIGNLSSLTALYLVDNQLTGFIPTTLGRLKQLQGIYLSDNRLQGYIPQDLCTMSHLVTFHLSNNMLTGTIPECLGEVTSLNEVYFDSNKLNSTIPSSFWNLIDILQLNLSSNHLSGQLSPNIGIMKQINVIDLSWNEFSGEIPSLIGSSQSIVNLSLAHNKFEGLIPDLLGNITNLGSLDISNNNLSGVIPKSLEHLRYLQHFNVSYNNLEGEIPTRGPFVHFTDQSFIQNSALCGSTRFHVQLCVQTHKRSRLHNVDLLVKYVLPSIISTLIGMTIILLLIRRRRKQNKVPSPSDTSLGIAWRKISYQELARGTNDFSETNLLGRGGFGSVFRGRFSDGLVVAIKVLNLQLEGASKSFDTESEILSTVRHRNLVRIIGCCCNAEFKSLILAYMPNGSLEKWLYSESYCLDMLQRLKIAIDVALALEHLHHGHTFPIVHCDIKPSNILLDEDMTAHVADFGLSKLFDEGEVVIQTNTLATIGYTAPEYGSEGKVSTNGDVYSYGILLLEIFTGKKPTNNMFSEEMSLKDWVNEALQKNAINEVVVPGLLTREDRPFLAKEQCGSSVFRLAIECLAFSPEERINMIQIVAVLEKIKTIFLASKKVP